MAANDAAVLAKFVFVVFGIGLTAMLAQLAHRAAIPHEAPADQIGGLRQEAHRLAGPCLIQRIGSIGVGDT